MNYGWINTETLQYRQVVGSDLELPAPWSRVPLRQHPADTWDPTLNAGAGAWMDNSPSSATQLQDIKLAALSTVDAGIGAVRLRYITEIPGQQMTYQAKEAEALAFTALPVPPVDLTDFPYIAAEAAALGVTAVEVANTYIDMSEAWRTKGVELEALRIGTKEAIKAALDPAAVAAVLDGFGTALAAV